MSAYAVLVVEDEADVRDVINEILELYGYSVTLAAEGLEGWKLARTNKYDLIITDLGIPGISGLELIRRIRAASIRTPVLIITGVIFENSSSEIRALRPCDVLLKPFRIDDLLKKIASLAAQVKANPKEVSKTK
jgi:DNA-binding response OmpR family regulator